MLCWRPWRASQTRNSNRHWTVSLTAGLLFRQGVRPHATYLFKHALVQDAAYGTLLREPRRALHARIAEKPREPIRPDCGKPARTAGPSLHRSGIDREGCQLLGQGGTAVTGALRAG